MLSISNPFIDGLSGEEAKQKKYQYQVKMNQDHFEDIFGSTDSLLAFIKADDVFDPEVLDAIDRLGNAVLENVPYVESVTSLMNLSVPIGTEEGFEVYNPFEDGIPEDPDELQAIRLFSGSSEKVSIWPMGFWALSRWISMAKRLFPRTGTSIWSMWDSPMRTGRSSMMSHWI